MAHSVKKNTYGNEKQILAVVDPFISVTVQVAKSAGSADGSKTIVKAGTPLTGDLKARNTAFTAASATGTPAVSNAVGVVLHDVDVTDGPSEAALVIFGVIDLNKVDTTVAALYTDAALAAMKGIFVLK